MPKLPSSGHPGTPAGGDEDPNRQSAEPAGRRVAERRKQYLVTPLQPAGGINPFTTAPAAPQGSSLQALEQALRGASEIDVVRTVGARSLEPMGVGADPAAPAGALVARMTDERARALYQQARGQLMVERDQHLHLLDPVPRHPSLVNSFDAHDSPTLAFTIAVLDKDGAPVRDAEVSLFGGLLPASGLTDARGETKITVHGESPHTIGGLYVKPRADFWSFYQRDPDLSLDEPNVVVLRALSEWPVLPGFPGRSAIGWGERAMRIDQLPPGFRGQGVKIAVIDSGAATGHPNLNRIGKGFDIINNDPDTWTQDILGHGSHCAGVIGGADPSFGIRGFAPEAEIHVCKLFPGGQISQLIEALEYCIEHQIDVVNLSLGGTGPSPALEQQILRARRAGVACIAAAGNSGGPVQYPAASPQVLAVAAIGKIDEFPHDSYHTETVNPDVDAQGYFTARFSCFGPQVDVCAPGVAIVSSVPPGNFAAWDGTSMAAPHITGLAALMLAHHPEFQGQARMRSAARVERLFQLIRMSARRVSLADPTRVGYGMPDALVALGLALGPGQQAFQAMWGSLLGGSPAAAAMPEAAQRMPAPMAPFGFTPGGMGPQGW
jgi:subtilisin family serine protease